MRPSATATVQDYLNKAGDRLSLNDLDDSDLEKVLEHIGKAQEELEKELE